MSLFGIALRLDLECIGVSPKVLCRFKIDTVLMTIRIAFDGIVFKFHNTLQLKYRKYTLLDI